MKAYYKVVRLTDDGLVSALMGGWEDGRLQQYQRSYNTVRWTTGWRGTPVLAFENLFDANDFARNLVSPPEREVWEALVRRPRKINRLANASSSATKGGTLIEFWRGIAGRRWSRLQVTWEQWRAPDGTVACDAIKLIRRVTARK